MNILAKYKSYRRLYPRLRFSWTILYKYLRNDWLGIWRYLTDTEPPPTRAMAMGREVHRILEQLPVEETISKYIGVKVDRFIKEGKLELHIDHIVPVTLVGVLDLVVRTEAGDLIVDYKTGKTPLNSYRKQLLFYALVGEQKKYAPKWGLLMKFNKQFEVSDLLFIEFTPRKLAQFEEEVYQAINEILLRITEGELDKFIVSIST